MFDILPALLWIVAAVISLNICSITAIRGNIFSKTKSDVYPVRWSIVGLHFTSLIIGALPYPIYTMFKPSFSLKFQHFYEQVGWPSAALMVMLIATELVFIQRGSGTPEFGNNGGTGRGETSFFHPQRIS